MPTDWMPSRPIAILLAFLLLSLSLVALFHHFGGDDDEEPYYPSLQDRHELEWNTTGRHSHVLEEGPYYALDVAEAYVDVELPPGEGGASWTGNDPEVHLSYWLPSNTLSGERVPVIAIVSPYFDFGAPSPSPPTDVVGAARGEFIFENFVPHGYAFAQVAVFGTEYSTHCFDYRGNGEQIGIDAAVTWLGEQEWSNGNVGLYGKSYEGATQWEAATFSNPYLKTIVPISGTTGTKELLFKNGSAEARSQVMHMIYFYNTVDGDSDDLDNACPDVAHGLYQGAFTYGAGELDPELNDYWAERSYLGRAIDNYQGSIYWIQGLQDLNVDSHMVFPHYENFRQAGFESRGMFGQWGHDYPDQWYKHINITSGYGAEAFPDMTRWDWGQDLFEWFEHYLKGVGPRPQQHVQVQRNDGQWRVEETWPPEDAQWLDLALGSDLAKTSFEPAIVGGYNNLGLYNDVVFESDGFDQDLHISGLARFHVQVTASGDGGQIFAELADAETGMRLGHATMDVRYHDGGDEPRTVGFLETVTMRMEFFGIDALLPAGHGLRLTLQTTGEDYLEPMVNLPLTVDVSDDSVLSLPIIQRGGGTVFQPPEWEPQ